MDFSGLQSRIRKDDKSSLSYLRYQLSKSNVFDDEQNPYEINNLFESYNNDSITETIKPDFNILDCEKEYSRIIGVALYNEHYSELEETLISIFRNRQQFEESRDNSVYEKKKLLRYLSKTLIVIIADGFEKIHKSIKKKFEEFGLYKDQSLIDEKKNKYKGIEPDPDIVYLFQGELAYDKDGLEVGQNENCIESGKVMKVVFAVKLENKGKLHSHLILFQLVCRSLQPEFVILLDTGTKPDDNAINILIQAMENKPHLSGCCGEIEIDTETNIEKKIKNWEKKKNMPKNETSENSKSIHREKFETKIREATKYLLKSNLLNYLLCGCIGSYPSQGSCFSFFKYFGYLEAKFILKAQYLEYKLAHCLQKTFDSSCGFIPVLPGAFCAYRWSALSVKDYYVLNEYLKPFHNPMSIGWSEANIYHLAEDRVILDKISKLDTETTSNSCWSSGHFLELIRGSRALTDGPNSLISLVNQRRRWNNGSWFSLTNTLFGQSNLIKICETKHSIIRKFVLIIQLNYYFLLVSFQWCSVGAYYLAYAMALRVIYK